MSGEVRCGAMLSRESQVELRRRMVFECGKWDPQYGDVGVLAEFPLVVSAAVWRQLAACAEGLAEETLAAEGEIAARPELYKEVGMPRGVRRGLKVGLRVGGVGGTGCRSEQRRIRGTDGSGPRFMRFDFHETVEGWRISEVNSDVPGGFIEAAGLARLMVEFACGTGGTGAMREGAGSGSGGLVSAGDPGALLADAVARRVHGGDVGLVHATAYTDDRQVMAHLAQLLEARGVRAHLISPDQVRWDGEGAVMMTAWRTGVLDGIVRFFPGEWLPGLSRRCGWEGFFGPRSAMLSNPATALLTQSKRFPLVWDRLKMQLPLWRAMLPETRDPREVRINDGWVLKPALGRVGEGVSIAAIGAAKQRASTRRWAQLWHLEWAAQRRFEAVGVKGPDGRLWYPCLGVFVVDGKAAGVYGRMSERPLIDSGARDVAVLVEGDEAQCMGEWEGRRRDCAVSGELVAERELVSQAEGRWRMAE